MAAVCQRPQRSACARPWSKHEEAAERAGRDRRAACLGRGLPRPGRGGASCGRLEHIRYEPRRPSRRDRRTPRAASIEAHSPLRGGRGHRREERDHAAAYQAVALSACRRLRGVRHGRPNSAPGAQSRQRVTDKEHRHQPEHPSRHHRHAHSHVTGICAMRSASRYKQHTSQGPLQTQCRGKTPA